MNQTTPRYAPIIKRFLAIIIDGCILSLVAYLFWGRSGSFSVPSIGLPIGQLALAWLYFALQESSSYQATIGKRVMDIHVTSEGLGKIDFSTASIRFAAKLLSSLILLIGYIMALFNPEKKTLHDRIAKTIVITD